MSRLRTAALLLALPAFALAQDAAPPDPTGTRLYEALPPGADLVVHTPSVPRLLASAAEAGIGTADAWRAAFREQLLRWGKPSGDPARLADAGTRLLALADGEAVVAALELPRLGSPSMPRTRSVVVAFRCRARERELRAHVDALVATGLAQRWPDGSRTDLTMGRPTLALLGPFDGLWLRVEDHLVAAADHPMALGLLFRGLERVDREARPVEDTQGLRLRVRSGRADAAERWEGTAFLDREGVSSPLPLPAPGAADVRADGAVVSLVTNDVRDVPLFPIPVPADVLSRSETLSARPLAVRFLGDGTWSVGGTAPAAAGARPTLGAASRLGWLRALASGRLPMPVPAFDADLFANVVGAADAAAPKDAPSAHAWHPTDDPHEIRGPAWHGPTTFLALRVLRGIADGTPPGTPAADDPEPPSPPSAPVDPRPPLGEPDGEPPPLPGPPREAPVPK